MNATGEQGHLKRELSLVDATAIYVGIILGSGIFFAPSGVASAMGDGWGGVGLWVVGGLIAACGALCYAECGARLPHDGGFYVFYREVFGEGLAFVAGWVALGVSYPASMAVIAVILGRYLGEVVPALAGHEVASAAVAVVLAGGLNVIGVRENAWSQRVLSSIKVLSIAALCVSALTAGPASAPAAEPLVVDPQGALRLALVGVLWTYSGWSDVTLVTGELRDPARNLGRTVLVGTGILVALYALVQIAVTQLLPAGGAAASERVLSDAVAVAFGDGAARVVALLVVVSTFGAINGTTLAVSRLGYAMALDGTVWRGLGRVHPRLGTPTRSIAAVVIAALVYVLTSEFRSLLELFTFSVWFFYALTAVALFVLRRRKAGAPLAWQAPGGPIAPVVVLATFLFMTASLLADPEQVGTAGLGALLIGATVPVYLVWRRLRSRRA